MQSEKLDQLFAALNKMQSELEGAPTLSENPYFKSKYADLHTCIQAAKPLLAKNGLSVIQKGVVTLNGDFLIETVLGHISGQFISGEYPVKPAQKGSSTPTPQEYIAAVTYARRASYSAIIGLSQFDDDGNMASQRDVTMTHEKASQMIQETLDATSVSPSYAVSFGKYKGKLLSDINPHDLADYICFLEDKAKDEGKPIKGVVLEFIKTADAYLNSHPSND